jgi:PAS domain S-box-containing protein
MAANDAVRAEVETLRHSSLQELAGAVDMVVALKETQLLARELVATSWRARSAPPGTPAAAPADAIERALAAFREQLDASRRATEAALAMAEQRGDREAAAREHRELSAWLDRIDDEIEVHRTLLVELSRLARTSPDAAERHVDQQVEPHYVDVLLPLIQEYQEAAERELREMIEVVEGALAEADRDNTAVTVFALALAGFLALLTARSIARPIEGLRDAAERFGGGDATVRVPAGSSDELGALARAFNAMAERLQATTVSKSYVDDIIRSMGEMLIVTDLRDHVQTVNQAVVEQLGWTGPELVGRDVRELIRLGDGDGAPGEGHARTRTGTLVPVVCTPRDLHDGAGRPQGRVWVARDIRRRQEAEEELRRSLADKEALLREVHHRVKNNLQVVSSLLALQAADSPSADAARLVRDSERRIRSMALIHEQLYRSSDLAHIDFREYVDGLTRNVLGLAGEAAHPIRVAIDVEPGPLDLDVAITCGMILSELLSNTLKHAFPDGHPGAITVAFHRLAGTGTLAIADDGVGFDGSIDGAARTGSLGLRLVTALVRQLRGTVSVERAGGTRVNVSFPLHDASAAPDSRG